MFCFGLAFVSILVGIVQPQDVDFVSTCVTDPHGIPRVTLENHSEDPMAFSLYCYYSYFEIYIEPFTTQTYRVYFPWQAGYYDYYYECVLMDMSYLTYALMYYSYDLVNDWSYVNYTYCSQEPGIEDNVQAYTDCYLNEAGYTEYNFVNNLNEEMDLEIYCYDVYFYHDHYYEASENYYYYDINPRSRVKLSLQHFDFTHNLDMYCVLLPYDSGFTLWYYMEPYDFNYYFYYYYYYYFYYLEAAMQCKGRLSRDEPIAQVIPHCPATTSGDVALELRADVPAYAVVHCRNGDAHFTTMTTVSSFLDATFYQGHTSDCQFYKQEDSDVWTLTVEVGWGTRKQELFLESKIQTLSCVYEDFGHAQSSVERVALPFFPSDTSKTIFHSNTFDGVFDVQILDVLDRQINSFTIAAGRRIRLMIIIRSTSDSINDIKAYSCTASNGVTSYNILQQGCGDGLILDRNEGFTTVGDTAYSPYFEVFHLRGSRNIWFDCTFTECDGTCHTSSCDYEGIRPGRPPFHNTRPLSYFMYED